MQHRGALTGIISNNASVSYVKDPTENTFHKKGVQFNSLPGWYLNKNGQLCFGFLKWDNLNTYEPIQWVNTRIKL